MPKKSAQEDISKSVASLRYSLPSLSKLYQPVSVCVVEEPWKILFKVVQIEQVAPTVALPVLPLFVVVNVLLNESVFNNSNFLRSRSLGGGKGVRSCPQGVFSFVLLQSLWSY